MTILIGRFIGLVRAIAPFIAGASRMELRKFLPYDVLGAGLWAALFCLLGYFFWQSLDRSRPTSAAAPPRSPGSSSWAWRSGSSSASAATRSSARKVQERLDRNPMWRRVRGPAIFVADHAQFGLELTTLLALAAVGTYVFFGLAQLLGPEPLAPFDREAFDIGDALAMDAAIDVVRVLTHVGSLPVTAAVVVATAIWAARAARAREGVALVVAHALTFALVHIAKDTEARAAAERPATPTPRASPIPPATPPTRSPTSPARS